MASVYLAHDAELDRPVAVKMLADHLTADEAFSSRFRREAMTAAKLAHPNVVQVFDTGEEDGRLFIVMEYVEGEGLDELVARTGRLPHDEVVRLADQACSALQHAHEHAVIHRDVKPANLLLRADGLLKVADFGIARAGQATQLTQVGTVLGTLNYLAPEQARGEEVTAQADIYALGAVLYELLTGEPPRRFENVAQLATLGEQEPRRVRDLAPEVPARTEEAVMRCLAPDPRFRPPSAAAVASELHAGPERTAATIPLARETISDDRTVPLRSAPARHRAYNWRALVVLAAIAAVVVAVVALAASGGDGEPAAPRVDRVQPADDAVEQARNLEQWLRDHTAGAGADGG